MYHRAVFRVAIVAAACLMGCGRLYYDPAGLDAIDAGLSDGVDGAPLAGLCDPPTSFQLSLGYRHACAIEDGALYCWGDNEFGQLGLGDAMVGLEIPTVNQVGTDTDWAVVRGGLRHTCGLRCSGEVSCWGTNDQGQLATGLPLPDGVYAEPRAVAGAGPFREVWVKRNHSCALGEDGSLRCWGSNGSRQLGIGGNLDATLPTQVLMPATEPGRDELWREAGLADDHTCAIQQDGSLWCWGSQDNGQLGQPGEAGMVATRDVPNRVGADSDWRVTVGGLDASCAIKLDQSLYCWGRNDSGQLGVDDVLDRDFPAQVGVGLSWQSVAFGYEHVCAIRADGTLWCWGRNDVGELGLGAAAVGNVYQVPTQVGANADWTEIYAGDNFTFGRRGGELYGWGENQDGRLGLGDNAARPDVTGPFVLTP